MAERPEGNRTMNANETTGAYAPSPCAEAQTIIHNRPALRIYHANAKGTGSALRVELIPATATSDGRFVVGLAPQTEERIPHFDWPREIVVSLRFADVCELVRVFRGECESIADGKGLYIIDGGDRIRVNLRHMIEPVNAYSLEVYALLANGEERQGRILLTSGEALGLCLAIEQGMAAMAFGIGAEG